MNLPFMKFGVDDWINDEHVRAMPPDVQGNYFMLICYCWKWGSIPNDVEKLGREVLKLTGNRLRSFRDSFEIHLRSHWETTGNGLRLVNKRVKRELEDYIKLTEARRNGARITNEKRWGAVAERHVSGRILDEDEDEDEDAPLNPPKGIRWIDHLKTWNEEISEIWGWPKIEKFTEARKRHFKLVLKQHQDLWPRVKEEALNLEEKIRTASWLTFDWLFGKYWGTNLPKFLEGNYRDRTPKPKQENKMTQEEMDEIARKALAQNPFDRPTEGPDEDITPPSNEETPW